MCASYVALVRRVRPLIVYRVTKLIAPPTKPLRKHERLTATLEQEGYVVAETGTDPIGRHYWLMSKA